MRGAPSRPLTFTLLTIAIAAASLPLTASAQSENQSYLPFPASEMRPHFPMQSLGEFGPRSAPRDLSVGASGANISANEDGDTTIRGVDRAGKPWSVQLGSIGYAGDGARVYSADLDRNGSKDLVFWSPTGGNGLAPSSHIFTLMFDAAGRPVPFEADGYFEPLANGFFDIADLDRDGRADLLYMNFDDGYWITNVYTAKDARWSRVRGRFGKRSYPLFTRFTNRPNHRATTPMRGRRPAAPDLSQLQPNFVGQLQGYTWADVNQSEDVKLDVVGTNGQRTTAEPISWYSSFAIVVDGKNGRRVATLSAGESVVRGLLDEIAAKKYRILLFGRRSDEKASPELLWAEDGN